MNHKNTGSTSRYYPIDMESIGDFSNFEETFSLPDTPERTHRLRDELFDSFYEIVNRHANSETGDALLLCLKMPMKYVQVFTFLRLDNYARELGLRIKCSNKSYFYSEGSLPISQILNYGSSGSGCRRYSKFARIKRKIRNIAYNIRVNRRLDYYFRSFWNGERIANTNPGGLDLQYLKNHDKNFYYLDESMLFGYQKPVVLSGSMESLLKNIGDELVADACKIAEKNKITVSDQVTEVLKKSTLLHLTTAAKDILTARSTFDKRIKRCVLLGGTNCGYFNRLASLLNRRNGGEVVVFPHGNEVGKIRDYRLETSLATEFITYNRQSVEDMRKAMIKFTPIHGNIPRVSSLNTPVFRELWKQESKISVPNRVKTIMLIGHAFSINFNLDRTFPDLTRFHVELKLIRTLIKAGYTILYKVHPESLLHVPRMNKILDRLIYDLGSDFKIITAPFEETMYLADAFLFSYTSTTTFNWAICSNKRVVAIDFDEFIRAHSEDALLLLSKRCKIIPHFFDQQNRLFFDEKLLISAFSEKNSEPNTEFLQKYLF